MTYSLLKFCKSLKKEPHNDPVSKPTTIIKWPAKLRSEHLVASRLFADRIELIKSLSYLKNAQVAELGVGFGDFSRVIMDELNPSVFHAYDVFRFHEYPILWGNPSGEKLKGLQHKAFYEARFEKEIRSGKMSVFEGDGATRLTERDDDFYDVVYIDASHDYQAVLRDAAASIRKLKRDGILIFNDYVMYDHLAGEAYGVVQVVNDLCVNDGWQISHFAFEQAMYCDIALRRKVEEPPVIVELPSTDELSNNQGQFPFPQWAIEGTVARRWILDNASLGGVGAEIGVFRGHFSEVILSTLSPRKFYMVDPWTKVGEFFPWGGDYTNNQTLPTKLARREAELRAAKFPNTETVFIEDMFLECVARIDEPLDWIYIDSSHNYKDTLLELKAAAQMLKPSGVIMGDDYYPDRSSFHHGVFRAVNEFVKTSPYEFIAAGHAAQWCLRRSKSAALSKSDKSLIHKELSSSEKQFPFPRWAVEGIRARQGILEHAARGGVGSEVGAFRGHFSEVILSTLSPRKLYMIDRWTKIGEFFPSGGDYTNNRTLPTKLARREAELRAAKFPDTKIIFIEDRFSECIAQIDESLDWIFLHSGHQYRQALLDLVTAAKILKPSGVIMGNDYFPDRSSFHHGVFRAVNEFVNLTLFEFDAVGQAGEWCLRRSEGGR